MKVDANMYWIPEKLFTDEDLREEFLRCIPVEHGQMRTNCGNRQKADCYRGTGRMPELKLCTGGIPGGASACGYGCGGSG